jgi:hypothetical protein
MRYVIHVYMSAGLYPVLIFILGLVATAEAVCYRVESDRMCSRGFVPSILESRRFPLSTL